ncbi:M15 family metallopeptidase [Aeromicrobium sp. CF3.5]|uniref:M15 family metallopeptidase n=1 Tax=Aeromicrobium sp. CF3.5 TaxID=3373078 RepID=UPI003EE47DAE
MHRFLPALASLAASLALLAGCSAPADPPADQPPSSSPTPTPTPTPSTTPAPVSLEAEVSRIGDSRWDAMVATGSWREGCPVGRADLRELEVPFVDFDGQTQRGVIVAHRDVMDSLQRILLTLHEREFPIERMEPVEAFEGDMLASLQTNNTSAFHCRRPDQINAPQAESPHANGRAIDINPDLNPWMDLRCQCWSPRATHNDRAPAPGKITPDDSTVRLFEDEGWIWQNISVADYMHFDTGYPSQPLG